MRSSTLLSLPLALALTAVAGCALPTGDSAEEETSTETSVSALTPTSGLYAITPIPIPSARPVHDSIALDASGVYYLSARATALATYYTAVHIGFDGKLLGESAAIAGAVPKTTRHMLVANGSLSFSDGKRTIVMPLSASRAPSYHPLPACGTGTYDCGNVAPDRTSGRVGIWQLGEHALRNVALSSSGKYITNVLPTCDLGKLGSSLTYSPSSVITSGKDETSGRVHVAARLADGRVVDCRGPVATATPRVVPLPFKGAGEIAFDGGGGIEFAGGGGLSVEGGGGINVEGGGGINFEGGGGIGFDPGGGLGFDPSGGLGFDPGGGIFVASVATPEVAIVRADGSISSVDLTSAAPGTAAYAGAIPRHLRTTGKQAVVVTADRSLYLVK